MKKNILFTLLMLFYFTSIQAQQTFVKTFEGNGDEEVLGGIATNDGGYVVYGFTDGYSVNGDNDAILMKIDSNGNELWTKIIGGNYDDRPQNGIQLPNGDIVIVGRSKSNSNGDFDAHVFKTDNQGNLLWSKSFGGFAFDDFSTVILTSDNHLLISGTSESTSVGAWDMYLVKLDLNGNLVWSKTYGNSGSDWLRRNSISENAAGNYMLAAVNFYGVHSGVLMEVSPTNGNILYSKRHVYGTNDGFAGFYTINGNNYIQGNITQNGIGHLWLSKVDNNYNVQWSKMYNSDGVTVSINSVTPDNNDMLISGLNLSNGRDGFICKVSSTGNVIWAKSYGGSGEEAIRTVLKTSTGYIGIGLSDSYSQNGDKDIFVVKTDNQGNVDSCANTLSFNEITITPNITNPSLTTQDVFNIQSNSLTTNTASMKEYLICTFLASSTTKLDVEKKNIRFKVYPNPPLDDNLIVEFENIELVKNITITNSVGQIVKQKVPNNSPSVELNLNGLNSGLYFITIYGVNGEVETAQILKP